MGMARTYYPNKRIELKQIDPVLLDVIRKLFAPWTEQNLGYRPEITTARLVLELGERKDAPPVFRHACETRRKRLVQAAVERMLKSQQITFRKIVGPSGNPARSWEPMEE
jgi:hypothetical protein